MAWQCEYTDTFAGEANYAWVRRATIPTRGHTESQASIMRRAKAALGLTGVKGRTTQQGGTGDYEFRPYGMACVAFVSWDDWSDEAKTADDKAEQAAAGVV